MYLHAFWKVIPCLLHWGSISQSCYQEFHIFLFGCCLVRYFSSNHIKQLAVVKSLLSLYKLRANYLYATKVLTFPRFVRLRCGRMRPFRSSSRCLRAGEVSSRSPPTTNSTTTTSSENSSSGISRLGSHGVSQVFEKRLFWFLKETCSKVTGFYYFGPKQSWR